MDVEIETKKMYTLVLDDDDMKALWKVFDLARDTIMRLPNEAGEYRTNEFMTDVESKTRRHEPIGYRVRME